MNNPNPLVPQGSLLEQKAKGKPHLRIAYIIIGVHLLFLGGLLIQGCKREEAPESQAGAAAPSTTDSTLPPLDGGTLYSTNVATADTNAPVGGITGQEGTAGGGIAPGIETAPVQPTAITPPPVEPSPATREYVVAKGDSFYTIGKKFGVSAREIAKANPTVDPNRLKIDQKLVIPAASAGPAAGSVASPPEAAANVYTVRSGDTLTKIAQAHGTTVTELRALNGLKTDRINVNQKLKLPAPKAAAAAPSAAVVPATAVVPAPTVPTNPAPAPLTGNP